MVDSQCIENNTTFGFDLLRVIAIVLILFSSLFFIYPMSNSIFSQLVTLSGFIGVEIFFVLSGFLLGKTLYGVFVSQEISKNKIVSFIKRRWFCTLPNYFLILIINLFITILIGNPINYLWKYFFFIQNFAHPMPSFFYESWCLTIIEFSSFIFPLLLYLEYIFFNVKRKSKWFLIAILILIFTSFIAKYYYSVTTSNTNLTQWNMSLKSVLIYRLDSVFVGALFSWFYKSFIFIWKKYRYLFAIIGFFLFVVLFIGVGLFQILIEKFPLFWNVFYLPLASISIALFLPFLSELNLVPFFIKNSISFMSRMAYSIYLLHIGVILQLLQFIFNTSKFSLFQLHLFTCFYLFLTLFLSGLLYRFYENPISNKYKN